jgi:polynucleotide kinase-phosphatase
MKISLPDPCLVLLVGPSGSGKSSFAKKHFKPTEVLSSDFCRGLVADDENDQAASAEAFAVLRFIAGKRLAGRRITVVDATNVQRESRKPFVALAREHDLFAAAIVLDVPETACVARNSERPDRTFGPHVVRGQARELRRALRGLRDEGFRFTWVLEGVDAVDQAVVERTPLWTVRAEDHGPFDIVGDVHGCMDELEALLDKLGYSIERGDAFPLGYRVSHPAGRRTIFLGDLVDRGPRIVDVLRLVMSMVETGAALCVPGNHENKLCRKLKGKDVRVTHGLAESLAQLDGEPPAFREQVATFIDELVSHYVLDDGKLVVAHAGMKEAYQGRASGRVREFALYGETTGEMDEAGLPVRVDWASEYRGNAMVVYGHTPVVESHWYNRTLNVDNGCVFGGKLTALRYPERELVSVPAARAYYASAKPFPSVSASEPDIEPARGELLDLDDVLGKRPIETALRGRITIREENATAALEVMSRFAVDPRWLIYLPPTMSPSDTSSSPDLLEHPNEAFAYYRHEGVARVICEEKHMGSRAIVVVCRDREAARARFGDAGRTGAVYTRTGRPFFRCAELERELLDRVVRAAGEAGLWSSLDTPWMCFDCELMPWSAKALELLRHQYAPVGAAARAGLSEALEVLTRAAASGIDVSDCIERVWSRSECVVRYVEAYRRYCWDVESLAGLKLAPFHLLASEGCVHADKDHVWHMDTCAKLSAVDPKLFVATRYQLVDVTDESSQKVGSSWWEALTESGGEGMVVKPFGFVTKGRRGIVQPAVKVRGREYLRIIYGPEYTAPANLPRLRARALGAKRSLALREFALGIEALERFVRREPLYRSHQCVFGVLALESEPVDPRL